jgi:hypothetical protein
MTNGEQANAITVSGGSPFSTGLGRLYTLIKDGVETDKGELRLDPERSIATMKPDGRIIIPQERDADGQFLPSNSPDYIRLERLFDSGMPFEHFIASDVCCIAASPEEILQEDYEITRRIRNTASVDSFLKEMYISILSDTNEKSTAPVRAAYSFLNYYLSEVIEGNQSVVDVLASSEGLDVLRKSIDITVLPEPAAVNFVQNYKGITSILGKEITGIILNKIVDDYNLNGNDVEKFISKPSAVQVSIQAGYSN